MSGEREVVTVSEVVVVAGGEREAAVEAIWEGACSSTATFVVYSFFLVLLLPTLLRFL